MTETPATFRSVEHALAFAFRHPEAQVARTVLSRMAGGPERAGNGLGGLDGAGQAGLILSALRTLGEVAYALAAAKYLPKSIPCTCRKSCCTGWQRNPDWIGAIEKVTDSTSAALPHRRVMLGLRQAVVLRHFGEKVSFTEIAKQCRVDRDTASAHAKAVNDYIRRTEADMRASLFDRFATSGVIEA
jgi:hypothetical protein